MNGRPFGRLRTNGFVDNQKTLERARGACGLNAPFAMMKSCNGAVAHSGERFNGIEEVEGSIPSSSTTPLSLSSPYILVLYLIVPHN